MKEDTYTCTLEIFRHHVCRLLLVDEDNDGRREIAAVEDLEHTLPVKACIRDGQCHAHDVAMLTFSSHLR